MSVVEFWLCVFLAARSSANGIEDTPSVAQHLCTMLVDKYNTFVDMVPLILPIKFPKKNDYFVGNAEVIFYPAEQNENSPNCTVINEKGITLFRLDVILRMVILNEGSRMELLQCRLEAHLRLQKDEQNLYLRPELVDVQIPGLVYRDGVLLHQMEASEILRPTLIKGFTSLAAKYLSYSGSMSQTVFVDPSAATSLFKQLFMSYLAQIV